MSSETRVAIVTGAASGIGRAIALRLADDGLDVAVNDLVSAKDALEEVSKEIITKGRRSMAIAADVSVEAEVVAMVDSVSSTLGSVDVMIANAGICFVKPFVDTTLEEWERIFAINTRGVFLCYKYAAKKMIAQGKGGRIIGASSQAGKQATALFSAYGATKFAVRGLTQFVAQELREHKITVNAYCPGAIATPMTAGIMPGIMKYRPGYLEKVEGDPFGVPEDISGIVSYLASKESNFVTGQTWLINGGTYCD
ncbi:NAD-binding protein [Cyathus striatus]|nr:NAD-binding protein [Cyathus striatus]